MTANNTPVTKEPSMLIVDFEEWLNDLTDHASRRAIADKAGFAQSTVTRQLSRGYLRPEMVIALCRAYGRDAVQGLIETGYLQDWETGIDVAIDYALHKATNSQLLSEILRRSDPEGYRLFLEENQLGAADLPKGFQFEEELAARRGYHFNPTEAVASSAPEEPGSGDDGYHNVP